MRGGEEQPKVASNIHFWPQKQGFQPSNKVENPFLQEMDALKHQKIFLADSREVGYTFDAAMPVVFEEFRAVFVLRDQGKDAL